MRKYFTALFIITASWSHAQGPLLWGTTNNGGIFDQGTIFKTDTLGNEVKVHDFGNGTDGQEPDGSMVQTGNGLLYGATVIGGVNSQGMIFSFNPSTGTETDLYDFGNGTDGQEPFSTIIQVGDSVLYGLTLGGGINGEGTIFSYSVSTGIEKDIYDFGNGTDGTAPYGTLFQASNGLLYGMTWTGGLYDEGIIFSYTISTGAEADLHDFGNGSDGASPFYISFTEIGNDLLYGMTQDGGSYGYGTIFSYNISTNSYSLLYNFGSTGTDGQTPVGSFVQPANGLLYGITEIGGIYNYGTIFSYDISSGTETDVYDFGSGTDGQDPYSNSPIVASNGTLYGMTSGGGAYSGGIIYSYNTSTGIETDIHDFGNGTDGDSPFGNLMQFDSIPTVALNIVPQSPILCSGTNVTLKVSGGTTYTWSPSLGLNATTGDSVVASPSVTTTYTATSYVNGSPANATDVVTVIPAPNKPTFYQHGDTLISSSLHDNQWYRNDTLLINDTSRHLIITALGNYLVNVNNEANGCSTSSDSITITEITGINQLSVNNNKLSIYPNPTSGRFTIQFNTNQRDYTIDICNVLGEEVYQSVINNLLNCINLSSQPSGMYFVYLKSETRVQTGKLILAK